MSVTTLIGSQFGDQDIIADIASGLSTTYYGDPDYVWYGDLVDFEYGKAYWITRAATNPATDYYLMGTVNPQAVTISIAGNAWTPFALNECRSIPVENLPIAGMVDQDFIADIASGLSTTYYGDPDFIWYGDLLTIDPTRAYWYFSNGTSFDWTYTPAARQATVSPISTSKVKPRKK